MTDKLKKALLKKNIQCIDENDGKFVFLLADTVYASPNQSFNFEPLFSREIAVGSILIIKAIEDETLKTFVFVCCNASQGNVDSTRVKNNLFWFEVTLFRHYISPK